MTQYYVHITSAAERDINRAADYIEYSLKNPLAADTLLDDTEDVVRFLYGKSDWVSILHHDFIKE